MTKKAEPIADAHRDHIVNLVNRCLVFTDRKGEVLDKTSTPVTSTLQMKYEGNDFFINFFASSTAMGNGICWVNVKYKGEVVLAAEGKYMVAAYDTTATIYIAGDWEKNIPDILRD